MMMNFTDEWVKEYSDERSNMHVSGDDIGQHLTHSFSPDIPIPPRNVMNPVNNIDEIR